MNNYNYYIWKILIRSSQTLKKLNLTKLTAFGFNKFRKELAHRARVEQHGGGFKVEHNGHEYNFIENIIDENILVLSTQGKTDCLTIIINKDFKNAEIHEITTRDNCVIEKIKDGEIFFSNQKVGTALLQIAIKMIKKYKEKFDVNSITLADNSFKLCPFTKTNIILSYMSILTCGDTWYGKHGFRPVKIDDRTNTYIVDKKKNKQYEETKDKMSKLKITHFNLIDYITMTNNKKLIKATKTLIKENPDMLLKDYIKGLLKNFDYNCKEFEKFYEDLTEDIMEWNPHRQTVGLFI